MSLVLSRKPGESIAIGDDVKITFIGMHGDKARIAIDAPQDVKVMRTELLEPQSSQPGPELLRQMEARRLGRAQ